VEVVEPAVPWSPALLATVELEERQIDEEIRLLEQDPPLRVWRVIPGSRRPRAPARIVGLLVHEALEHWRFPGDGFERWVTTRAREYGLADQGRLQDALKQTGRMVAQFKAHPLYAEMQAAELRLHELPYSLVDDGGLVKQGVIDVLFLKDGAWTVLDYKTDRLRDEASVLGFKDKQKYRVQVQSYGAAVEQITGHQPRLILLFLNYGGNAGGIYQELVE
jgi:ATP-dependent exoDNAse (exonuclease V) beta subunit